MAAPQKSSSPSSGSSRREIAFLGKFLLFLTLFFVAVAPKPMDEAFVKPFTNLVAKAGGAVCSALGENTSMTGTIIRSPRFAVDIKNGCNGLETMFIFAAGVLAFPSPWKPKLLGLLVGMAAIQLVNLVRIVALFFTGVFFPELFEQSHTVVWQAIVVLAGVLFFLLWASRFARPRPAAAEQAA
ncbi:MAG: exosortase H [Acidobacteria bacterium]|nr:exosortase H [Acidobacteriota bacterium]